MAAEYREYRAMVVCREDPCPRDHLSPRRFPLPAVFSETDDQSAEDARYYANSWLGHDAIHRRVEIETRTVTEWS